MFRFIDRRVDEFAGPCIMSLPSNAGANELVEEGIGMFSRCCDLRGMRCPSKAVGACIDADAKACPLVFNNCM